MPETAAEAYDRGELAGQIAARLAGHDKHFGEINGQLTRIAVELAAMTLALQRLGDQAVVREATVLTTAAALKAAEDARRANSERSWSPLARVSLVMGIVVGVAGMVFAALLLMKPG